MHEKLILNIVCKKMESIQEKFEIDLPGINSFLLRDKVQLGGFETKIDCACSINIFFKHLENGDDEGVILEIHISKSVSHVIDIDICLFRSNGPGFASDDFLIDLKAEKAIKCTALNDLYDKIDNYYELMKKVIQEEYLPQSGASI